MTDGEERCYDHEVERQSSRDNNSKLMDILGSTLNLQKALRNALQEIAEFLKAAHGGNLNKCQSICLPDEKGEQTWRFFHNIDIGGLPRSVCDTPGAQLSRSVGDKDRDNLQ